MKNKFIKIGLPVIASTMVAISLPIALVSCGNGTVVANPVEINNNNLLTVQKNIVEKASSVTIETFKNEIEGSKKQEYISALETNLGIKKGTINSLGLEELTIMGSATLANEWMLVVKPNKEYKFEIKNFNILDKTKFEVRNGEILFKAVKFKKSDVKNKIVVTNESIDKFKEYFNFYIKGKYTFEEFNRKFQFTNPVSNNDLLKSLGIIEKRESVKLIIASEKNIAISLNENSKFKYDSGLPEGTTFNKDNSTMYIAVEWNGQQ